MDLWLRILGANFFAIRFAGMLTGAVGFLGLLLLSTADLTNPLLEWLVLALAIGCFALFIALWRWAANWLGSRLQALSDAERERLWVQERHWRNTHP